MKKCPYCAEEIQDEAIKCKHCGSFLTGGAPPAGAPDALDYGQTVSAEQVAPGRLLGGRYRVEKRLGGGGMGQVFLAADAELNDMPVAVKVLPPVLALNDGSVEALKREAAIAFRLTHPNICRLYNFHAGADLKFLVMEYIDGPTLEGLLDGRPDRAMPVEALLPIARDVAEALDHAHGQDPPILHRDVKPSNIMVGPDGRAKVLDFGIAREMKDSMTRVTGQQASGTLLYMSPEQFSGDEPTAASDVYSFAATLYECLAGRPPFHRGSIAHQLLHMQPAAIPGAAADVNAALLSGLAKRPGARPPDAAALTRMLEASCRRPIGLRPPPLPDPATMAEVKAAGRRPPIELEPIAPEPIPAAAEVTDADDAVELLEAEDYPVGPGRATAAAIFGVLSIITLFAVVPPILFGILAYALGSSAQQMIADGRMSPLATDRARVGRVCGIIGIIIAAFVILALAARF